MATIKRGGNRIITKVVNGQRRVSCSCCPSDSDCCLYSSAGFQTHFFMKDLPDKLFSFGGNIELFKTNYTDEEVQANFNVYQSANWEDDDEYIYWTESSAGWFYPSGGAGFCLLGIDRIGEDNQFVSVLTDDFEDTYTVTVLFGDSFGTYTVTRRTTCVWSEFADGDDFGGVRIIGGSLPDGTMIWSVEDGGGDEAKSGDLNSPVGDYGIPTTRIVVS
jgi:hypothetical protein